MSDASPPDFDALVVGSGPAGLGAAIELRRLGVGRVCVLEREAIAGGMPRHCGHPPFGLHEFARVLTGPAYAARLREAALAAGVTIRTRHTVTSILPGGRLGIVSPEGEGVVSARKVILATGARERPRSDRLVGGQRPLGIVTTGALQRYVYEQKLRPFRKPVIVGSELVSLSAILTCRKGGMAPAAFIDSADRPIARWPLSLLPRMTGIPTRFGTELLSIEGGERVRAVTVTGHAGRTEEIACDGVVFSGKFVPEAALPRASHLTMCAATGGPSVDQFGRCSDASYYATGNLLRTIENAAWCFEEGRRTAANVVAAFSAEPAGEPLAAHLHLGGPIRFASPDRLISCTRESSHTHFNLRIERRAPGVLRISVGEKTLYWRQLNGVPERRVLIPMSAVLPHVKPGDAIDVEFVPTAGGAPADRHSTAFYPSYFNAMGF